MKKTSSLIEAIIILECWLSRGQRYALNVLPSRATWRGYNLGRCLIIRVFDQASSTMSFIGKLIDEYVTAWGSDTTRLYR